MQRYYKGTCTATWKREFKLSWREAGPLNHHDDKDDQVDSDHLVVNTEPSLCRDNMEPGVADRAV